LNLNLGSRRIRILGVDAVYCCLTCKTYFYNGRAIEGQRLREYLSGKVTKEKIERVKKIWKDLTKVFDEGWLFDYHGLRYRYDLSTLIDFLERHLGHEVYIGTDHDIELPMDWADDEWKCENEEFEDD
ncbi:MAG: hypothetical protein DRJ47_10505, partial [Thermoprotei archaeon]